MCGLEFITYASRNRSKKFCSRSCQSKYRGNVAWDKDHRSYTISKVN